MSKIHILHLGDEDISEKYKLAECADWIYEPDMEMPMKGTYDMAILGRQITQDEIEYLFRTVKAYCLFFLEGVVLEGATEWIYKSKKGKFIETSDLPRFLVEEPPIYYPKPYGEKYQPFNLSVVQGFQGEVKWNGFNGLVLNGDYGSELKQIAFWMNNIPVAKDQAIDFWLEYKKDPEVEIALQILQFRSGTVADIQNSWSFTEEQLDDVVYIDNKKNAGPIFVSVLAKGKGKLEIIALHDRYSRKGRGNFLPGGERLLTSDREEIFFYFDPGDMKPPLNVYFSGYKTQEGYEGYNLMRRMGTPFLLVTESRLEGGAFYMGSDEFESMLRNGIQKYIDELGFTSDQVIFSGLSMGTFGALYYGCQICPSTILLGKPLASIGNVAANERINRPGVFPTSLDVLWKQYRTTDEEAVVTMNERFWNMFDDADWENTKFILSYMIEDDYDSTAFHDLISHITSDKVTVYGKGLHGRHNDDTSGIVNWFVSQYYKVLSEDFGRNNKD